MIRPLSRSEQTYTLPSLHPGQHARKLRIGQAESLVQQLRDDVAKVGGDREVAALVTSRWLQARPLAQHAAAFHAAAQHERHVAVAVVCAVGPVLADRAAELG